MAASKTKDPSDDDRSDETWVRAAGGETSIRLRSLSHYLSKGGTIVVVGKKFKHKDIGDYLFVGKLKGFQPAEEGEVIEGDQSAEDEVQTAAVDEAEASQEPAVPAAAAPVVESLKELFDEGVVKRDEIFITTKLAPTHHRPEHVEGLLKKQLTMLKLYHPFLSPHCGYFS